jgi:hypothetical protein
MTLAERFPIATAAWDRLKAKWRHNRRMRNRARAMAALRLVIYFTPNRDFQTLGAIEAVTRAIMADADRDL